MNGNAYAEYPQPEQVPSSDFASWFANADGDQQPQPEQAPKRRLAWFSRRDLDKLPRQKFLPGLEGLLVSNTLAVIFGPPGAGKSFCTIDWSAKLAVQGMGVLYVAAEGAEGIRPRLIAWERANNDGVQIENFILVPETANLMSAEDSQGLLDVISDAIEARAAEQDSAAGLAGIPVLIVIDTLARSMPGGNENDQQDISKLIDTCEQIRKITHATVLLVHHTNKAGFLRGSTVIPASMESIVELKPSEDKSQITMHIEKQKNHAELPDTLYRLQDDLWTEIDPETGEDIEMTSCVFVVADVNAEAVRGGVTAGQLNVMKVLGMPALGPAVSLAMIVEHSGLQKTNATNKLNELMKRNPAFVARSGHGHYQLTEDGKTWLGFIEESSNLCSRPEVHKFTHL